MWKKYRYLSAIVASLLLIVRRKQSTVAGASPSWNGPDQWRARARETAVGHVTSARAVTWPRAKGRASKRANETGRAKPPQRNRRLHQSSSGGQIWLPCGRIIMRSERAVAGNERVPVRVWCCWRVAARRPRSTADIMEKAAPDPRPVSAISQSLRRNHEIAARSLRRSPPPPLRRELRTVHRSTPRPARRCDHTRYDIDQDTSVYQLEWCTTATW